MDAKHKGSLAELLACAWLLKQGYEVFRNVSQHGVADLIAWREDELPLLVEVKTANFYMSKDGKSCSYIGTKSTRHPHVRFLYVITATGECGFDLEPLVAAKGYTLRPAAPPMRLVCTVEGCGRKHVGRGFCSMHHDRWSRGYVDGASLVPQPKAGYVNRHLAKLAE